MMLCLMTGFTVCISDLSCLIAEVVRVCHARLLSGMCSVVEVFSYHF